MALGLSHRPCTCHVLLYGSAVLSGVTEAKALQVVLTVSMKGMSPAAAHLAGSSLKLLGVTVATRTKSLHLSVPFSQLSKSSQVLALSVTCIPVTTAHNKAWCWGHSLHWGAVNVATVTGSRERYLTLC